MIKKILFISHEASRSGAPLILLHLLKWLNNNTKNIQFDVLLFEEGVIADDFRKECTNTFVYSELHKELKFVEIVKERIASKFGNNKKKREHLFLKNIALNEYDLIYGNTVVSIPISAKIKILSQHSKLLVHVHELNTVTKMVVPNINNYIKNINKFIAVSQLVKDNLIDNYSIPERLISLIYEFAIFKQEEGIKTNNFFTVGASGYAHWRKGDDIFIQVANYVTKKYPMAKINFVWVGSYLHNKYIIKGDIEKFELNEKVSFVGEQADPINFYKNFDVFLLTSREDPFPLVCIEAANLKKPIICFEKASGTAEVIEKGGGFVVPYLDIEAMGEKIMHYYKNPSKIDEDGLRARELFADFTPEKICLLLYEQINSFIKD